MTQEKSDVFPFNFPSNLKPSRFVNFSLLYVSEQHIKNSEIQEPHEMSIRSKFKITITYIYMYIYGQYINTDARI